MSIFITLLAALVVFSAVIAIHEFGHFTVAKLCGIQVNEFSIGMGPALWKKIYKGTQYSLRALPVGGYVALEGEESPESQNLSVADGDSSPNRGALGRTVLVLLDEKALRNRERLGPAAKGRKEYYENQAFQGQQPVQGGSVRQRQRGEL